MSRTTVRSMAASLIMITILVAAPAIGCYLCKRSPDGMFGFCNPTYTRGFLDCSEYVYDSFDGTSTCSLSGTSCGLRDDGGGGGDPNCWWTDQNGGCILYY